MRQPVLAEVDTRQKLLYKEVVDFSGCPVCKNGVPISAKNIYTVVGGFFV
jgi:hypothetical protein